MPAEELERSGEEGTPGFRQALEEVGEAIEKEYPKIQCIGCKKTYQDPVWRCQPCAVKKMKVLGEYKTTIDPVRMMLAMDARAKVKFDAEKFLTVKLRGHGLGALKTLHEVVADVDPSAACSAFVACCVLRAACSTCCMLRAACAACAACSACWVGAGC